MLIRNASFVTSVDCYDTFPGKDCPEIAIVGRSNVGKSSLINALTNRGKLARTSAEPGKTRLMNVFSINNGQFLLVDLPGYGFARVSREEKARWGQMIEGYLSGSRARARALMLVDMRHAPTDDDVDMIGYLRHYDIPFAVVATKADKLSRAEQGRAIPLICRRLAVQPWDIIPFSAVSKVGCEALLELFERVVPPSDEARPLK